MTNASPKLASRTPIWRRELAAAYTRLPDLLQALGLRPDQVAAAAPFSDGFTMRVPRGFVARMEPGNPQDPLLRQVLPLAAETIPVPGFGPDPVGERASALAPGLLQKYQGRALLVTTGSCAVHCRYCFRRQFPYAEHALTGRRLEASLTRLRHDASVEEAILSGGDPLTLSDSRLTTLLEQLGQMSQLQTIRIHTRVPIVLPERIDAGLLRVLDDVSKTLVIVLHCNHANEIDVNVARAAESLAGRCVALLNQAVLLRGVNDDATALVALSKRLFEIGVLPYYLHQLDPVEGAAHFAVTDEEASALVARARASLPGYLVPRLVREVAGAEAKLPV